MSELKCVFTKESVLSLREYEFTLIASAQLSDSHLERVLKKYEDIWCSGEGWVVKKDVWGTLKMAYPIKKQFRGYYVCYNLATTPQCMADAEKKLRIDGDILRYLNIKLSDVPPDPAAVEASQEAAPTSVEEQPSEVKAVEEEESNVDSVSSTEAVEMEGVGQDVDNLAGEAMEEPPASTDE